MRYISKKIYGINKIFIWIQYLFVFSLSHYYFYSRKFECIVFLMLMLRKLLSHICLRILEFLISISSNSKKFIIYISNTLFWKCYGKLSTLGFIAQKNRHKKWWRIVKIYVKLQDFTGTNALFRFKEKTHYFSGGGGGYFYFL